MTSSHQLSGLELRVSVPGRVSVTAVAGSCDYSYLAPGPHRGHGGLDGAHSVRVVAVIDDNGGLTVGEHIEAAGGALLVSLESAQAEADHVQWDAGAPAGGSRSQGVRDRSCDVEIERDEAGYAAVVLNAWRA